MFLRLKNLNDYDAVLEYLQSQISDVNVLQRMREVLQVLDDNYGAERGSTAMGGYIFWFESNKAYQEYCEKMLSAYGLHINAYEYSDEIGNEKQRTWTEELYLLGSDDSIVVLRPKEDEERKESIVCSISSLV